MAGSGAWDRSRQIGSRLIAAMSPASVIPRATGAGGGARWYDSRKSTTIERTMLEKSPETYHALVYFGVVVLSILTGTAGYLNHTGTQANGASWRGAVAHISGSIAAGLTMFFAGEGMGLPPMLTAVCVSLAAHSGGSLLGWAERIMRERLEAVADRLTDSQIVQLRGDPKGTTPKRRGGE